MDTTQSTRKKIAIVIPLLRKGGGAEKIASWLSRELTARGYELSVITFWERDNEHPIGGTRFNIRSFLVKIPIISSIVRAINISRIVRGRGVEIVLSFTEEASAAVILLKFLGYRGRIILSMRNNPLARGPLSRLFIRAFYRFADEVIALSKGVEKSLSVHFGLKNTRTIYNPCDIASYRIAALGDRPADIEDKMGDYFVFAHTGRMIPQKGHFHLLRAFAEVVREFPDTRLLLLGGGILEKDIKVYARTLNISNHVIFAGIQENVYPFLKKAKCFVFSSLWEGLSNAIIEALAVDKPVISFDCESGPRELIDDRVSLDATLSYPYYGLYGILTKVPEKGSRSHSSTLLPEEKMLADIMKESIQTDLWYGRYKNSSRRVSVFEPGEILREWVRIL